MITYAKSYMYFLMLIKDTIKTCKACKECNTEIASRISTESWYRELAVLFYFNMVLRVLFLHNNTIAESQVLAIRSEFAKYNCSETSGSLFWMSLNPKHSIKGVINYILVLYMPKHLLPHQQFLFILLLIY